MTSTTTSTTSTSTSESILPLPRFPHLTLHPSTPKGRGIYTTAPIPSGTTVETSPVLPLSPAENSNHIEKTGLYHYTYNWPLLAAAEDKKHPRKVGTTQAVILGLGSMFNHSARGQNVGWERDAVRGVMVYRALRDIAAGEELCISYGDRLTFEDVERAGEEEDGEEQGEEVLGRIEIDGTT